MKISIKIVYGLIFFWMLLATTRTDAQVAIGFEGEVSAYQWNKKPRSILVGKGHRSSGQIISLPSFGPKIWFGDWEVFTVSIESKIDFSPFTLDVRKYKGMGAVSFPTILKFNYGPFNQGGNDGATKIGIGGGVQWTKSEIYAKTHEFKNIENPFFMTYLIELSCQLVVGGADVDGNSIEIFIRPGFGKSQARTFSLGVKYNVRWIFG